MEKFKKRLSGEVWSSEGYGVKIISPVRLRYRERFLSVLLLAEVSRTRPYVVTIDADALAGFSESRGAEIQDRCVRASRAGDFEVRFI